MYSERLEVLKTAIPTSHSILNVVSPVICEGREHFLNEFKNISKFSEGIILRNPKAWYFEKDGFFKKDILVKTPVMQLDYGNFKWPNGQIYSLSLPNLPKDPFIILKFPVNEINAAEFVSAINSDRYLFDHFFHFYISTPYLGARCRGCHQLFNPGIKCVQTKLIYNSTFQPISFCLTNHCLEKGFRRYEKQYNTIKSFENVIWVYEKDLKEVKNSLPDIKWEIIPMNIKLPKK